MALKKTCAKCRKIIDFGVSYCDKCQVIADRERREFFKEKFKNNRKNNNWNKSNKESMNFYNSNHWKNIRDDILNKYKGLDLYDYYINNKITHADTVHHIEELTSNWDRRYDVSNLIPLSYSNHRRIHLMYRYDKDNTMTVLQGILDRWSSEYRQRP